MDNNARPNISIMQSFGDVAINAGFPSATWECVADGFCSHVESRTDVRDGFFLIRPKHLKILAQVFSALGFAVLG
jgi:hypothetical protein